VADSGPESGLEIKKGSMTDITHRTIETNGINLHIAEAGEGPLVLFIHGWPELWYSWRHQLPALAAAGFHAVAPDVRGYGQSDCPEPIEAYSLKNLLPDFTGILDAMGEQQAVIVGHDWGAALAWNSAALYPERYRAVVGMSVPYFGRGPMQPTEMLKAVFQDNWFYILYFQEPGVAEAEFEADTRNTMRLILAAGGSFDPATAQIQQKKKGDKFLPGIPSSATLPAWLSEADLDYFAGQFTNTGFRGGLNRYRNMDRDWEEIPELADKKITQPALFITGANDPVKAFTPPAESMKPLLPDLRGMVEIAGAGHWVQQEKPSETNAALIEFLKGL
jgi:pimeloyl-ACP methyl ester carboxylesterase